MPPPDWKDLSARMSGRARGVWAAARLRASVFQDWVVAHDPVWRAWRRPGRAEKISAAIGAILVISITLFLILFDWNHLRGPIGRWASAAYDRDISLDGDLDVRLFSWTPSAVINDLRVGGPEWAAEEDTLRVDRLEAAVRLRRLLAGQIEMPLLRADAPRAVLIADEEGRQSWLLGRERSDEPASLPLIERLIIRGGELVFEERRRGLTLNATVNARETAEGVEGEGAGGFLLEGEGALNNEPLTVRISGGPLVHIRRNRPYEFRGELSGARSRLEADGSILRPFDLGRFDATLSLSGQDMADLYLITGLVTPNTPPYALTGALSRDGGRWTFNDFSGEVGDSDLSGDLSVDRVDDRLRVEADLASRVLDIDDLIAVIGGAPDPTETASPEQRAQAGRMQAQGRLLPDAPLRVERLRTMDGRLSYRAESVRRNELAIRQVSLGAALEQGVLTLDPIAFAFAQGELNGTARIDARQDTPRSSVDLRLAGYPLEAIIPARDGQPTVTGRALGRARLEGPGASVADFAAASSGTLTVIVPQGQIREAFAELLGINVGRGLRLLLSGDERTTPIRCAVASFDVRGGVGTASTFVVDTDVVTAAGEGTIDLRNERLDLRVDGESKEPRLLRVWAPITVSGPIRSPSLGVDTGALVGQGGLIGALATLVAPVAGLLGLVDPGLTEDADCARLISEAR